MKRILLTGARAPVTLDLVRHFHRSGHEVYLADSIYLPLARLTRFAKRTFVVSKPVHNPSQFVQDLATIARDYRIDLVVPTCEEIFYVSSRLEFFPEHTKVFSEPLPKLEILHNKWKFVQQVSDLGGSVQAPETHLVASQQELSPWIAHPQPFKWVFKPVYSRFAARTLVGPTSQEIAKLCPTATDPWVVQRRVLGQEFFDLQRRTPRKTACSRVLSIEVPRWAWFWYLFPSSGRCSHTGVRSSVCGNNKTSLANLDST